jgi:ribonuclease R
VVWPARERQSAAEAIEELMRERGLARSFDRQVERAARRARDRGLDAHAGREARRDLTDLATLTIDPATARDFDDAISAQTLRAGERRIWVHIADVSAFVKEGSPVDLEARRRGNSVYVPGAVEPMLPQALSNDACSLLPGSDRLAVTVELDLRDAQVLRSAFYRSIIRSDARLDYEQVDRIFAGREPAREPWREALTIAREAAGALADARARRGSLSVDSEEPEFRLDEHGNVEEVRARSQTESHRLIEHLMIAANEAVAGLLEQRRVPCLYRVHERPDPASVERLVAQLDSLGVPSPPLPEHMSASQAAELVGPISSSIEQHARRSGHGRIALSSLLLRALKQAYYSPKNLGHAGLQSLSYCHFTSPIRRYPDLVCHRALLSAVGGGERAPRASELAELGSWTSEREREAMVIERDADAIASCFALEQQLYSGGWEQSFSGEVVGLIGAGAFIAFGGPVAGASESARAQSARASGLQVFEGLLPVRRLPTRPDPAPASASARAQRPRGGRGAGDWWELNELGTIMHAEPSGSTISLGDGIEVRVVRVEPARGRAELEPVLAPPDSG